MRASIDRHLEGRDTAGVKAVVTAKDIVDFPIANGAVMLGIQDMRWMCRNVMARDKALFPATPSLPLPPPRRRSRPKPAR
jgi:hypothetical protein